MQLFYPYPLLLATDPYHFPHHQFSLYRLSLLLPPAHVICLPAIAKQPAKRLLAPLFTFPHNLHCLAPDFFRIGIPISSSAIPIIVSSSFTCSRTSYNSRCSFPTSSGIRLIASDRTFFPSRPPPL